MKKSNITKDQERQDFNQEIAFLKEMIKAKDATIAAYKTLHSDQLKTIERISGKRIQDEDYNSNDLKNIMRNRKASSGNEMSEEQINELIEQKRKKLNNE